MLDCDPTFGDHRLYLVGQDEDPQPPRHMPPRPANPSGYLRLRPPGVHQPSVPDRFIHRVEVETLEVLDEGGQDPLAVVASRVDQRRHRSHPGRFSSRHPAVTGYQVPPLAGVVRRDRYRRQHPHVADRLHQVAQVPQRPANVLAPVQTSDPYVPQLRLCHDTLPRPLF